MEIILSKYCKSFTGTISRYHGYAIRKTGNRYLSCRTNSRHATPDGHWKFIVSCAELAKQGFMFTDIRIGWEELQSALYEAKYFVASEMVRRNYEDKNKVWYDARDILNLKTTFGL